MVFDYYLVLRTARKLKSEKFEWQILTGNVVITDIEEAFKFLTCRQ